MRIKHLQIKRDWCDHDKYTGEIEIDGESSSIKFQLTPDRALRFLELALTEFKLQSDDFAANLLADLKALPCPTTSLPTPSSTTEDQ